MAALDGAARDEAVRAHRGAACFALRDSMVLLLDDITTQ
jgi:hypothetical protein